jgi:hypothetical protein
MTMVVNNVAFDMRSELITSVGRLMTIRSKGFTRAHMVVQKARSGSRPVAEVGSIRRGRFEGWAAQQFGESVDRTRVPSLLARSSAKRKVVKSMARLKKGRDIPTAEKIAGKSSPGGVIAMMRILARRGDRRPFIIHDDDHPKFPGGLYEMRGRKDKGDRKAKLNLLQRFDSDNAQPSRMDWVNPAWRAYQKSRSIAGEWRKAFNLVGWQDVMRRAR